MAVQYFKFLFGDVVCCVFVVFGIEVWFVIDHFVYEYEVRLFEATRVEFARDVV